MRRFSLLFVLVAGLCAAAALAVQNPPAPPPPGQPSQERIRIRVDRVPVLFSALDRKDRFVTDLTRDEVRVFDNKKKQEVIDFAKETDLPLRIGLLIDTSNSIRDRFKFEQEAAIEFLQSVVRPEKDRAFVVSFDTNVEVVQDFTDDVEKLSQGVRSLRAGGGTALYDALYYAVRDKLMNEDAPNGVRRTVILISDGDDNQSRASREDTLAMTQRGEVTVFAIGTNISRNEQRGDRVLRRFAEETGGRVFFPFRITELSDSFQRIGDELRSQYALLFRPTTPRDGAFHIIELESLRKGIKLRARKGYFAVRE